ncbi:MAG: FMN-binding protein [Chloroflexota bacterium]|nr:FMN-binding protein [Chloroflexota bacterium]
MSDQLNVDAPAAVSAAPSNNSGSAVAAPTTTYNDGSYIGNGNSRHGGMQVTVVIKGGRITSANVTSCGTRYPCSDVDALIRAAVSKQSVPANHVSGATDSSQAYRQALTSALKQAKA